MTATQARPTVPMKRPAKVTCFRCHENIVGTPTTLEVKTGFLRNQGIMPLCGNCSLALDAFIFPTQRTGA
jgi:hypothetical protein